MRRLLLAAVMAALSFPAFGQSMAPTVNLSVTITNANVFQSVPGLTAGASSRRSLTIQNNNLTDNCWVFLGATASATKPKAILLIPGGSYQRYYPYIPNDNVAVTCVTAGDSVYVDTQ
jgi:hypothetical protein